MSALFPNQPKILNGAEITPPINLPNKPNVPLSIFFNGLTTYLFNDSPKGLITLSLNTPNTFSFMKFHPLLNMSFTPCAASIRICFIGSIPAKNGSATLSYKKSDIFKFHSFIVILNESNTSISKNVLNLSIRPPERLPSNSFSPNNQVWNLSELAAIPPAIPNKAPPIGPPGKKNDGIKPNAPAPAPIPPKKVANLGSIPYLSNVSLALL